MITKNTFATMIVPIEVPTWINAARPPKACPSPHASSTSNPNTIAPKTVSFFPTGERHSPSYTSHAPTMLASPIPTACPALKAATDGSTIIVPARIQYTSTSNAVPDSHVV